MYKIVRHSCSILALVSMALLSALHVFAAIETLTQPPLDAVDGGNYTIRSSPIVNVVGSAFNPNDIYVVTVTGNTTVTGTHRSWNGWAMQVDSLVGPTVGATPQLGATFYRLNNYFPVSLPMTVNDAGTFYVRSNCPFRFSVSNDAGMQWSLAITWNATLYSDALVPVAKALFLNAVRNQAKVIQLVGTDPNNDPITSYEVAAVSSGTITPAISASGLVTATPTTDPQTSMLVFSYRVKDSTGLFSQYAQGRIQYWDSPEECLQATISLLSKGVGVNGVWIDPGNQSDTGNGTSSDPIIYATGDLVMAEDDLDQGVVGWGHRRTYSIRSGSGTSPHGPGWIPEERPFLSQIDAALVVTLSGQNSVAFQPNGLNWAPIRPYPGSLFAVGQDYVFNDAYGNRVVFYGFTANVPGLQQGQFKAFYRPSGDRFLAVYNIAGQLTTVTRQMDAATSEEIGYTYAAASSPLLTTVQRRVVKPTGTAILRTVEYVYYAGVVGDYGELDNLKSVQVHDGAISGPVIREYHYRYHRTAIGGGALGGLRYVAGPRSCARMRKGGLDPLQVADGTLATYADKYIEYTNLRVTRQNLRTPDVDGSGTFTYSYSDSGLANGFNTWKRRTTETYPDNSVLIVYTNYAGGVLLKIWKPSSAVAPLRLEGWQYDSAGRETWHLQPNVFTASGGAWYDEVKSDLLDIASGNSPYLKDTDGRIDIRVYYGASPVPAASATVPGGVEGYLQYLQVKQGELGATTTIKLREYLSHSN